MNCPKCDKTARVIDSRNERSDHTKYTIAKHTIHRRRECVACGYRFSTTEKINVKS